MDFADHDREMDNAYRAIGRYVVAFSSLMQRMRELLSEHVAGGIVGSHEPELLLGEAMPTALSNAFFGMCRLVADLDENESKVESAIRKRVKTEIEMRNDVAHGDWEVGWFLATPPYAVRDPHLIRLLPGRSEGPRKVQSLSVLDIDRLSSRILALLTLVNEFGHLALGLPIMLTLPTEGDSPAHVSTGEYRVRDVLVAHQEKRSGPVTIKRDGPRAREVFYDDFDTPYTPFWDSASAAATANDSAAS
jgi:hypothetical protein